MRKWTLAVTAVALLSATTAQAAQDAGLSVQNYRSAAPQSGVGAQLGVTLKLDSRRVVRDSDRVQIGFAAGPVVAVRDARTGIVRRGISNMAGFSLRPGHSASVTLAGRSVATSYTALGAAEDAKDQADKPKKNRKGPSTVGWIAIGVGTLFAGLAIYIVSACGFDGQKCSE